jgi:hypothetical protein
MKSLCFITKNGKCLLTEASYREMVKSEINSGLLMPLNK